MGHWKSREEKAGKQRQLLQGGGVCSMLIWFVFTAVSCRVSVAKVFITSCIFVFHSCPVCAWNPCPFCMPLISSTKRNFTGSSQEASRVLRGARVLARRETDSYYYLGHIVQEVKVTIYWELGCKGMYGFSPVLPIPHQSQALSVGWPSSVTVHFIATVASPQPIFISYLVLTGCLL